MGGAVAAGLDAFGPGFRRAMPAGGQQRATQADPAMRAGPDAGVIAIAPIGEVVPAFAVRSGIVGNFVGQQAEFFRLLRRRVVQRGPQFVVRQHQFAAPVQCLIRGAGLDGELVK